MNYDPLKITAFLRTAVVSDGFLPLDSVLYYQANRERYGEQVMTIPGASVVPATEGNVNLPFMKKNRNTVWLPEGKLHNYSKDGINLNSYRLPSDQRPCWYYACSFGQFPSHTVEGIDYWSKRFDIELSDCIEFGDKKGRVDTTRGRYKSYYMPRFVKSCLHVEWYAMADIERLRYLLQFCTHIGAETGEGFGRVIKWRVERWHKDWSVYNDDGKLMRAIPHRDGILYAIRPSYWNPRHQFPCLLPEA